MNYTKIIDTIKNKTDDLMAKLPPTQANGICIAKNGSYTDDLSDIFHLNQWTHSFFTGIIGYLYYHTQDEKYSQYLKELKVVYKKKIYERYRDTMHDLGFVYTLFAVALYKLTGDVESREMAIRAADELGKRFQFKAGVIQAWGTMDEQFEPGMMICDCMMNLPLLFWAYEETKHPFYKEVAVSHANKAMRFLVRDDYSVRHAYTFDTVTGEPRCERNYCGFSLGSAWARGTAWMIYGFAIAYDYTKDVAYLDTANGIAQFYLKNLPDDGVPVYDFKLPRGADQRKDICRCHSCLRFVRSG